ncbi:actin cortical patch SUR7/pH-response regulator pali [Cercophora newfieldiana]|uniref:Actin cortical patch SUR7/pH-response regulator pali n=1 Tax=Cercophora newfieldiana TaxID=92897 RepID=A0AA39YPG2_9PEZI|nr:actin cortical patch SUR7/pH-response regulator pali [Cercophora newfieldiana]
MAISRLGFSLISIIFLGASLVMLWFLILSGLTHTSPLSQTYFLRANTSDITGSRPITQWTYFFVCGLDNNDCGPATPALPIGHAWSGSPDNAPAELVGGYGGDTTSFMYWYLWRFGTVFYLITLFFTVIAFFSSFLACCGRLGSALTGLIAAVALLFNTVAVCLMTATFVKMRNAFLSDNRDASLGTYAFGFAWGSWAALLISTVLFCVGKRSSKSDSGAGWGTRRRVSTHSRKSYEGRRVKEEYP